MSRLLKRAAASLFGALLAVALSLTAYGQERRVTLSEAIALFTEYNLELKEARARVAELSALARQAAAYPNPSAVITHEPMWRGDESYSETYFNLSQRLEWPGLRSARIEAAEQLADAAYADLQADSLRLIFEVTKAFTEAAAASRRRDVLEEVTEIFRRANRASEAMQAGGEVSGYRVRRLRVERAHYENRLALAELDAADSRRRLALLIFPRSDASPLFPADAVREIPTDLAFETALRHARAQRAEMTSARANVEAARSAVALARGERLPEPTLTAGYKRQSDGFTGIFLGTALPIPLFNRNQGVIAARQHRRSAAEARLSLVEARIEVDVRRAHETYASLSERVELISEGLLAEADALLHAARVGYAEGEMSLVELLDAAAAYRDARISRLDLISAFQIAYYDLLRAAGGTIDRASFTTISLFTP